MELGALNALDEDAFAAELGAVFEHSPWVARRTWAMRPFRSIDHLHQSMMRIVAQAAREEQLALVRAHPELAGREASEGTLTAHSSGEQARLGFASLSKQEFEKMQDLNAAYRRKFGFPCIVALRLHATRAGVMQEMERRTRNDAATELANALEQIGHITHGRLKTWAS